MSAKMILGANRRPRPVRAGWQWFHRGLGQGRRSANGRRVGSAIAHSSKHGDCQVKACRFCIATTAARRRSRDAISHQRPNAARADGNCRLWMTDEHVNESADCLAGLLGSKSNIDRARAPSNLMRGTCRLLAPSAPLGCPPVGSLFDAKRTSRRRTPKPGSTSEIF